MRLAANGCLPYRAATSPQPFSARVASTFWHRLILAVLVKTCHIQDMTRPKRPRDTNQLAKHIVDLANGEREDCLAPDPVKEFARAGGLKGGRARAKSLSPERRSEIARTAAHARWRTDEAS